MTRILKSHTHIHPDEEDDDTEYVSAGTDGAEGKGADQKPNNHRSKHSETEQRRRSKINDRFQILKDLIPPNDQKKDKASLLLEVIEYIQLLQEKLQVYEGLYPQVWCPDPPKLMSWKLDHEPGDNSDHPSQAMRNGSVDDDNETQAMSKFAYNGGTEHSAMPAASLQIPLQPFSYLPQRSITPAEDFAPEPSLLAVADCAIVGNEGETWESGSSSVSGIYSQVLLKRLNQALETSGVDMSQANISVELDIGRVSTVVRCPKDVGNQPWSESEDVIGKAAFRATKRNRTGESYT